MVLNKIRICQQTMHQEIHIPKISFSFDESSWRVVPEIAINYKTAIRIHGPNGAGKSTYLKLVSEYLKEANISYSYIPSTNAFLEFLENESVESCALWHNCEYMDLLSKIGTRKKIFMLSQGEKQLLGLCCFLKADRRIWILDESLEHLDAEKKEMLISIINQFLLNGGNIIYSQHSEPFWLQNSRNIFIKINQQADQLCFYDY